MDDLSLGKLGMGETGSGSKCRSFMQLLTITDPKIVQIVKITGYN